MSRSANLPVPVGQAYDAGPSPRPAGRTAQAGAFDAQLLGQDGRRRGLKGGPPVLTAARSAYLEAEWSGPADRRLPTGIIARAKV